MIKKKFVSGLPASMPLCLNERQPPSIEESVARVRKATEYRRFGRYRGPRRSALEMAGIRRNTQRMLGEREDWVKYLPCDELGANLHQAGYEWGRTLDLPTAEHLIEQVSKNYRADRFETFEELLEKALDKESIEDGKERHAYKMALGLFFGNRARRNARRKRDMNEIPFAPR